MRLDESVHPYNTKDYYLQKKLSDRFIRDLGGDLCRVDQAW